MKTKARKKKFLKIRDPILENYVPRTPIGRAALEARRAYFETGGKPLTLEELDRLTEESRE